ncbi:flippase [Rosistilla oblonga]|uniref:flippase n=1 Tax=Rosistilla oblonga TaxID=2527990 RepID=UPI003A96F633
MTTMGKIRRNAVAIFTGDLVNKASTFAVYAMLSRYTSLESFGLLQFGLLVLYTFNVFAAAGLPTLLTRRVARHANRSRHLLYHGYAGALASSLLAMLGMILFAFVMRYDAEMRWVLCLLSIAIVPYALTLVAEAVIRGRERMHLIALANLPGNALLVGGAFAVLSLGYSIYWLAAVVITARTATFLLTHAMASYCCQHSLAVPGVGFRVGMKQLKHSLVFFGNDGVNAIWSALDQVMLSKFASEREIGLLGSSYQILQPILMVYRAVGTSAFPTLCYTASRDAIAEMVQSLIGLLWRLSTPAAIGLFLLADEILVFAYGNEEFRAAAVVIRILVFTLFLDPVTPLLGHALWATKNEAVVLRIVLVNLMANVVVGCLLISQFGLIGAAVTYVSINFFNVLQHKYYFRREIAPLALGREWLRGLPATLCLLAVVACFVQWDAVRAGQHHWISLGQAIIALTLGMIVYVPLAFPGLCSHGVRMVTGKLEKA